jgi:hypothetical protein
MQFVQDEFLLLSRGGRVGPGTRTTGPPSPQEQARRELVAQARRRRVRRTPRFRAWRSRSGAALTAAVPVKRS